MSSKHLEPHGKRPAANPRSKAGPHSARRRWLRVVGIILAVLVGLQLIASPIAKAMVNRKLAELPGYTGKVNGLTIAFWRAGAEVTDFVLSERGQEQDPPVIRLQHASFRFAPGALFEGKLGGAGVVDGVELTVIKREEAPSVEDAAKKMEQQIQEKKEQIQRWQDVLREAFPMSLERLEVKNTRFQFVDRSKQPNAEVAIDNLHIVATDLQNRAEGKGEAMPAKVNVTGVLTGEGKFTVSLRLDPIARQPHFALNFELRELQLPQMNSFLLAYADADVSRGTFELFSEINAEGGAYDGYVKPLLRDIEFTSPSDEDKSVGERVKERVVSAVTSLLENEDQNQVATKAPFAGNFANNDVDVWTTIVNLMRNAFIQAIRGGLEGETPTRG